MSGKNGTPNQAHLMADNKRMRDEMVTLTNTLAEKQQIIENLRGTKSELQAEIIKLRDELNGVISTRRENDFLSQRIAEAGPSPENPTEQRVQAFIAAHHVQCLRNADHARNLYLLFRAAFENSEPQHDITFVHALHDYILNVWKLSSKGPIPTGRLGLELQRIEGMVRIMEDQKLKPAEMTKSA